MCICIFKLLTMSLMSLPTLAYILLVDSDIFERELIEMGSPIFIIICMYKIIKLIMIVQCYCM